MARASLALGDRAEPDLRARGHCGPAVARDRAWPRASIASSSRETCQVRRRSGSVRTAQAGSCTRPTPTACREHLEQRPLVLAHVDRYARLTRVARRRSLRRSAIRGDSPQCAYAMAAPDAAARRRRRPEAPCVRSCSRRPPRQHRAVGHSRRSRHRQRVPRSRARADCDLRSSNSASNSARRRQSCLGLHDATGPAPWSVRSSARTGPVRARRRSCLAPTSRSSASSSRTAQRHEAPERLAAVCLRDAEMGFALEEARDEVSICVGQASIHLQIVPFLAAESAIQGAIMHVTRALYESRRRGR